MGKDKKEKKDKTPSKTKEDSDGGDGELRPVCAIAKPLADIGFHKKILKVVKKGTCEPYVSRRVSKRSETNPAPFGCALPIPQKWIDPSSRP